MKINYIIASWNGKRAKNVDINYYESVLRNHLNHINTLKNNITQITIMKPNSDTINNYYSNICVDNKIKIIECKNEYFSYGQWLKAIEIFLDDFDYHILIEDDYVPAINNFDEKLIEIYEEGTYLCSLAGEDINTHLPHHCRISNGLISSNTIRNLIKNKKYSQWFTINGNHQICFSNYLKENAIKLVDYTAKYMVDYHAFGKITDYSSPNVENKEKIFTPIQNVFK